MAFTVIGSIAAFILQVLLAPNIAVFDAVPNFTLCFVVLNAMLCTQMRSSITGFVLGLAYDLLTSGALGVMSLVLSVLGYLVSSLNKELFAGSWAVSACFLLVAALLGEFLYAALLSILGVDSDFIRSVGMRVVPGTIYDGLFGLVIFPLMKHLNDRRNRQPDFLKGKLS
jgi:rod shape-determining protein MreD